jgi:hypothetical protein
VLQLGFKCFRNWFCSMSHLGTLDLGDNVNLVELGSAHYDSVKTMHRFHDYWLNFDLFGHC